MSEDTTYNGWLNYATWNVALWIDNDERLNRLAVRFMSTPRKGKVYLNFLKFAKLTGETKDGVEWLDKTLDYPELNETLLRYAQ